MTEKLKVANFINKSAPIVSCKPDDTIEKAKTLMLLNDYSQLPILSDNAKIVGSISWKSIGKSEAIRKNNGVVTDYQEEPAIIKEQSNFLNYIKLIAKKEYVFVTNSKNDIKGIITTYDMTLYFRDFITPFLRLGIIEDSLRKLIIEKGLEIPKDVNELMFYQYLKIFEAHQNWEKLNFHNIDKNVFIEKLDQIRLIRNKVAHYKPDPLTDAEHFVVYSFADIIQKVST